MLSHIGGVTNHWSVSDGIRWHGIFRLLPNLAARAPCHSLYYTCMSIFSSALQLAWHSSKQNYSAIRFVADTLMWNGNGHNHLLPQQLSPILVLMEQAWIRWDSPCCSVMADQGSCAAFFCSNSPVAGLESLDESFMGIIILSINSIKVIYHLLRFYYSNHSLTSLSLRQAAAASILENWSQCRSIKACNFFYVHNWNDCSDQAVIYL